MIKSIVLSSTINDQDLGKALEAKLQKIQEDGTHIQIVKTEIGDGKLVVLYETLGKSIGGL